MAECLGNRDDHCCWLNGRMCPFLRFDVGAERRWVCSLREELGSWEAVHDDERYVEIVKNRLDKSPVEVDCGNWPPPGEACAVCGACD